jgi:hypothetical protein
MSALLDLEDITSAVQYGVASGEVILLIAWTVFSEWALVRRIFVAGAVLVLGVLVLSLRNFQTEYGVPWTIYRWCSFFGCDPAGIISAFLPFQIVVLVSALAVLRRSGLCVVRYFPCATAVTPIRLKCTRFQMSLRDMFCAMTGVAFVYGAALWLQPYRTWAVDFWANWWIWLSASPKLVALLAVSIGLRSIVIAVVGLWATLSAEVRTTRLLLLFLIGVGLDLAERVGLAFTLVGREWPQVVTVRGFFVQSVAVPVSVIVLLSAVRANGYRLTWTRERHWGG